MMNDAHRWEQAYYDLAATVELVMNDLGKINEDSVEHAYPLIRVVKAYAWDALRRTQYFVAEGEQLDLKVSQSVREKTRALIQSLPLRNAPKSGVVQYLDYPYGGFVAPSCSADRKCIPSPSSCAGCRVRHEPCR